MPLRVERSELRCDSGGEGRTRGGLGLRREIRLLDGEARYSVLSDRAVLPPFVLRLAPRLAHALRLETGDLVEMLGRHAAPLRAWVRRGRGSGVTHDARKNQRRPQPVCATSACVRRRLVEADGSLGDLSRADSR